MEPEELNTLGGPWDIVRADELLVEIDKIEFASTCPTPSLSHAESSPECSEPTSTHLGAPQAQVLANCATNPDKSKPEPGSPEYAEHFQKVKDQIKELISEDPTILADLIPEEELKALLKDPQAPAAAEPEQPKQGFVLTNSKIQEKLDRIQAMRKKLRTERERVLAATRSRKINNIRWGILLCRQECPYRIQLAEADLESSGACNQLQDIENELEGLCDELFMVDEQRKVQEKGDRIALQWSTEPRTPTNPAWDWHQSETKQHVNTPKAAPMSAWRLQSDDLWQKSEEQWRKSQEQSRELHEVFQKAMAALRADCNN